jgi:hypothetical protein
MEKSFNSGLGIPVNHNSEVHSSKRCNKQESERLKIGLTIDL